MYFLPHQTYSFIFLVELYISRSLKYSLKHQLDIIDQMMLGTK